MRSHPYTLTVDEFVERVRDRDYYHDQIQFQREVSAHYPETRPCTMNSRVTDLLADRGIDELYAHQTDAIGAVRDGHSVVLATPTASGKSLTYILEELGEETALSELYEEVYLESTRFCKQYAERVNYPAPLALTRSVRAGLARRLGGWDSPTRSRLVAQGQTPAAI